VTAFLHLGRVKLDFPHFARSRLTEKSKKDILKALEGFGVFL
jgi:hypothetical protein